ncbi:hypothetical protein HMN09_00314300 [Mycena chlorophos]|uniref:RRM domain-containing protein n=1 Tax=Mycena chlorophos TaxID=658473 RepID=A0A8H6TIS1_MYCCL|nr:hypothetical protein HMN09_00314300 [Mycena chlorophos]
MYAFATRALRRAIARPQTVLRFNSTQAANSPHRLYVGGLAYAINDTQLAQEFSHCGEIVDATVSLERSSGRSRGFGHVQFATAEGAAKALEEMDGTYIEGRAIRVNPAREREQSSTGPRMPRNPPSSSLYVGNLAYETTQRAMEKLWGGHEGFREVWVPKTPTGEGRGIAFVRFEDTESARMAMESVGSPTVDGRQIFVDFATERREGGADRRGGRGFGFE